MAIDVIRFEQISTMFCVLLLSILHTCNAHDLALPVKRPSTSPEHWAVSVQDRMLYAMLSTGNYTPEIWNYVADNSPLTELETEKLTMPSRKTRDFAAYLGNKVRTPLTLASQERSDFLGQATPELYIGGLFDMAGERGLRYGLSELMAANVAISHVNRELDMKGYQLLLLTNNSKVSVLLRLPLSDFLCHAHCTKQYEVLHKYS